MKTICSIALLIRKRGPTIYFLPIQKQLVSQHLKYSWFWQKKQKTGRLCKLCSISVFNSKKYYSDWLAHLALEAVSFDHGIRKNFCWCSIDLCINFKLASLAKTFLSIRCLGTSSRCIYIIEHWMILPILTKIRNMSLVEVWLAVCRASGDKRLFSLQIMKSQVSETNRYHRNPRMTRHTLLRPPPHWRSPFGDSQRPRHTCEKDWAWFIVKIRQLTFCM